MIEVGDGHGPYFVIFQISLLNSHSPGINPGGMCFVCDNLYQDGTLRIWGQIFNLDYLVFQILVTSGIYYLIIINFRL